MQICLHISHRQLQDYILYVYPLATLSYGCVCSFLCHNENMFFFKTKWKKCILIITILIISQRMGDLPQCVDADWTSITLCGDLIWGVYCSQLREEPWELASKVRCRRLGLHLCTWWCQALHMLACWGASMAGCRGRRPSLLLSCHGSPISPWQYWMRTGWIHLGHTGSFSMVGVTVPGATVHCCRQRRRKHQYLAWTLLGVRWHWGLQSSGRWSPGWWTQGSELCRLRCHWLDWQSCGWSA